MQCYIVLLVLLTDCQECLSWQTIGLDGVKSIRHLSPVTFGNFIDCCIWVDSSPVLCTSGELGQATLVSLRLSISFEAL